MPIRFISAIQHKSQLAIANPIASATIAYNIFPEVCFYAELTLLLVVFCKKFSVHAVTSNCAAMA